MITQQFRLYLAALARLAEASDDEDSLREEMRDLWRHLTDEEQDLANELAKVFVEA